MTELHHIWFSAIEDPLITPNFQDDPAAEAVVTPGWLAEYPLFTGGEHWESCPESANRCKQLTEDICPEI